VGEHFGINLRPSAMTSVSIDTDFAAFAQ